MVLLVWLTSSFLITDIDGSFQKVPLQLWQLEFPLCWYEADFFEGNVSTV